jgi:hypothetical protein
VLPRKSPERVLQERLALAYVISTPQERHPALRVMRACALCPTPRLPVAVGDGIDVEVCRSFRLADGLERFDRASRNGRGMSRTSGQVCIGRLTCIFLSLDVDPRHAFGRERQ